MSEHCAAVSWTRTTPGFDYDGFDRRHRIGFRDGRVVVAGDAAADYGGQADAGSGAGVDPEAMFAASLGACHMLSFLAVAARMRIIVDAYEDTPVAIVDKDADGRLAVTRVVLRPRVSFPGYVELAKLRQMHEIAHRSCFVANAVKAAIAVEPQLDASA